MIMENFRENIKVYHCNNSDRCKTFLEDSTYLIESTEDGIWLGSGLYFWDNLGNAQYWKKEKIRKAKTTGSFSIVSSNIFLENVLDLTDLETCEQISLFWDKYCILLNINNNIALGKKLNILFSAREIKNNYNIIKIYGKYNQTKSNGLYEYDIHSMKTQPTLAIKCIYNVKDANCIFQRNLVE